MLLRFTKRNWNNIFYKAIFFYILCSSILMKKIKLITLFFLSFILFSNCLQAQIESEKDSLESLLPFAKDYQRVDIYIALADLVKQTDTATAINYAQQSFKISNKISYSKGLAGAYIILGFIDRSRSDYKNAKTKYLYAISYAIKSNDLNTISLTENCQKRQR